MLTSFVWLIFTGPDKLLPALLDGSNSAVGLCLTLISVYAVWMGLLQIMEDSGMTRKLSKALSPLTFKLFGKLDPKTQEFVCMNISANMLGMGGAATPLGIKAMKNLDDGNGVATKAMIMFFVLNATSLQILPTTVMGLRAAAGSVSPSDIILPSIIATVTSTIIGVLLVLMFSKRRKK